MTPLNEASRAALTAGHLAHLVTLDPGGAPELLQRLAEVYLGPGVTFPPMPDPPPGFVLRTTPTRVLGVGPWT